MFSCPKCGHPVELVPGSRERYLCTRQRGEAPKDGHRLAQPDYVCPVLLKADTVADTSPGKEGEAWWNR